MLELRMKKCSIENDVIEVGEEDDTKILSAPKKKTLGTSKKQHPKILKQ